MRIHTKNFIPLLFAVSLAALAGCGQNKQAAGPAPEPEVSVVTIAAKPVKLTTVLSGRTSAHLVSDVRPQVGGIIQKRLFKEGSDVKAGEVLYQIDPSTYQAAYDNAKAALAQAEANAMPARLKAERYANLIKANGVSKQDYDDAQAADKQTQAAVIAAKANLETARINLGYTRVTAPISGRIGKSSVTPGALVTASQATALSTVQQINPIYVDVTQSSAEVLRLKRDLASGKLKKAGADSAKVKLLYEDGTTYGLEGVLEFSDITVDQSTGVVTLRALFPNPKGDLLPGLYVRAVLEEGMNESAILVPQAAVMRDSKGQPQVMAVKADNTVEVRPITVDRVIGTDWLVSDGLAAGDRVIVAGLQKVKPGMKVKPVEAAAAPAAGDQANATAQNATAPAAAAAAAPTAQPQAAPAAKAEAKPEPKKDAKPEAKPEVKPEPKKDAKPAAKPAEKKPEAKAEPKKDAGKTADKADKAKADEAPAKKENRAAYSPPKGEPWPTSTLDGTSGAKPAESAPSHQ